MSGLWPNAANRCRCSGSTAPSPGQSQKEFFVNAALVQCDALLHPVIEGEAAAPPADSSEGEGWLVGASATGDFAGRSGSLAFRHGSGWLFAQPRDGMRVLDRATGQQVLYLGEWRRLVPFAPPAGGSVVDAEARSAIAALAECLKQAGIFPAN